MGRFIKKLFRWTMHGLAVFALLVAIASSVFWVRSMTSWDEVRYQLEHANYEMASLDGELVVGRLGTGVDRASDTRLGFYTSSSRFGGTLAPWSYFKVGWTQRLVLGGSFDQFDFLGVQWYPNIGNVELCIPFSYLLILSLSFAGWWFWRVRKQWQRLHATGICKKCGYNLQAHVPGQNCPECGTVIA